MLACPSAACRNLVPKGLPAKAYEQELASLGKKDVQFGRHLAGPTRGEKIKAGLDAMIMEGDEDMAPVPQQAKPAPPLRKRPRTTGAHSSERVPDALGDCDETSAVAPDPIRSESDSGSVSDDSSKSANGMPQSSHPGSRKSGRIQNGEDEDMAPSADSKGQTLGWPSHIDGQKVTATRFPMRGPVIYYHRLYVKCKDHPNCGKYRNTGIDQRKLLGDIEPVAFLGAWLAKGSALSRVKHKYDCPVTRADMEQWVQSEQKCRFADRLCLMLWSAGPAGSSLAALIDGGSSGFLGCTRCQRPSLVIPALPGTGTKKEVRLPVL